MLDILENQGSLEDFLKRHSKPYDPATDDYDRPPFAADIKEGKNDPIYNAHSYHTKVPPRSIVPYILHYTKPGDLVLDPFCGSGMTGVAAQTCANPPGDILEQYPELKDRIGLRACMLNDLSPAACHIAYNYNTPVDVDALKREFERIMALLKEEFDWLYWTEHYEPAVGDYSLSNPEVLSQLANPPIAPDGKPMPSVSLLKDELPSSREWTLISRAEVEKRLGYSVSDLAQNKASQDIDLSKVDSWICIPAMIQYTIWSDVYRCEGMLSIEEANGRFSTRGRNAGKPMVQRKTVTRGCGEEISLWYSTNNIDEGFVCGKCSQRWTTEQPTWLRTEPNIVVLSFTGIVSRANKKRQFAVVVRRRRLSREDIARNQEISSKSIPYWFPTSPLVPGEEGNRLINRGMTTVNAVYTKKNLYALAAFWNQVSEVSCPRLRSALQFLFTSVSVGLCSKLTRYNFGRRGNGAMAARLFIPHFQAESNVLRVLEGKLDDLTKYYKNVSTTTACRVSTLPAQSLSGLPDNSVDFLFADPPFGRNIAYSELNLLWEAWLGNTTIVEHEAITSNARKWNNESYNKKMRVAFREMYRIVKPARFALIEFNNRDPELFESIKSAAVDAGFVIRNMLLLDKDQKTFKQVQGILKGEGTLDKDVIFNLEKPSLKNPSASRIETDLSQQVAEAVRNHLLTLPERIKADPAKYSDDHRTSATINSMLMNVLIPKGISVERLNLLYIEQVCGRYFRKVGQRWYLRGEAIGNGKTGVLIAEETQIKDEESAVAWLRQRLADGPKVSGELKPLWMRATVLLPIHVSQQLDLDALLRENFWKDGDTNRWREPTPKEREKINDSQTLHVLHDAERFLAGSFKRTPSDQDRCEWIEVIFRACRAVEEQTTDELPALRDFDPAIGYQMISQLFHGVLRENVPADVFGRAEKQARVTAGRLRDFAESGTTDKKRKKPKDQMELEL